MVTLRISGIMPMGTTVQSKKELVEGGISRSDSQTHNRATVALLLVPVIS